jgi:hypothetical protein
MLAQRSRLSTLITASGLMRNGGSPSEAKESAPRTCIICLQEDSAEFVKRVECRICRETYAHDACLLPWLLRSGTCPTCRAVLVGGASDRAHAAETTGGSVRDEEVSMLWNLVIRTDGDARPYLWPLVIFLSHAILGFTMFCVVAECEQRVRAEAPSGGLPIWSPPRARDPRIVQFGQAVLLVEMILAAFVLWRFAELPPWTVWWYRSRGDRERATTQRLPGARLWMDRQWWLPRSEWWGPVEVTFSRARRRLGERSAMEGWSDAERSDGVRRARRATASAGLPELGERRAMPTRDLELICVALCGVSWVWSLIDMPDGTGAAAPGGPPAPLPSSAPKGSAALPSLATSASYLLLAYMLLFSSAAVAAIAQRRWWRTQFLCLSTLFGCGIAAIGRAADTQWVLFLLALSGSLMTTTGLLEGRRARRVTASAGLPELGERRAIGGAREA